MEGESKMKTDKYSGNELKYLQMALSSQPAPKETWCRSLEQEFADAFNAKYAIAMNSHPNNDVVCLFYLFS